MCRNPIQWKIYEGIFSHTSIIEQLIDEKICKYPKNMPSKNDEGFMTDDGTFVDRTQARKIALEADQLYDNTQTDGPLLSCDIPWQKYAR